MQKKLKKNLSVLVISILLLAAIAVNLAIDSSSSAATSSGTAVEKVDQTAARNVGKLVDNQQVYANDTSTVKCLYVTVYNSSNKDGKFEGATDVTFSQLNSLTKENDRPANLEIACQEGDESGPQVGMFGYKAKKPNGVIQIRGRSTSETDSDKKSYKITLYKKAGLWNNESVIDLNKHPYDLTRIRNKLCFDLFKNVTNFTSLRTQFVHLFVKDMSSNDRFATFQDYGLFTQIEQPNKSFLSAHGLDKNGVLYKAENFEFSRSANVIKNDSDPGYNKEAFEKILNRKAGSNNEKLIQMLDDLNNYSLNINDVIDKHFDRDNYLTWLAANILLGNMDTKSGNYYLYSPSNSDKWYFLPWDYDGSLDFYHQLGKKTSKAADWEEGIANYWGTVLGRRFFSDKNNIVQLENKMNELNKTINSDSINNLLKSYYPLVFPIISTQSEVNKLPSTLDNFKKEYWRLANIPAQNEANFSKELEKPMPFFLGSLTKSKGKFVLNWDRSYDIQGESLAYTFILARDPNCKNVILQKSGIKETSYTIDPLKPGTYYWKVIATDSKGNSQGAFDKYKDDFKNVYQGVQQLIVQ